MASASSASHRADPSYLSAGLEHCPFPRGYVTAGHRSFVPLRALAPAAASSLDVVSLSGLVARTESEPTLPVAALIFHCSRCGSTLLARLLALDPANRVFAEPDVLAKFAWRHHAELSSGSFARELRAFIRAFGLGPRTHEQRLVLKLSSHALVHLPAFRAAFPDVPFFYLFREPSEVVASLTASEPHFLREKSRARLAEIWGLKPGEERPQNLAAWAAWYIERNLSLGLAHRPEFAAAIDYRDHVARYLKIAGEFSEHALSPDNSEVVRTLGSYSKDQRRGFHPGAIHTVNTFASRAATPASTQAYHDLCAS